MSPRIALAALALLFALACGPIPGGTLDGTVTLAPADWTTVLPDAKKFCEIEARPEDPTSIQLECFLVDGKLYAQSHRWALAPWWPVESWAAVWIEHPDVKVRMGDAIYELRALRVMDAAERDPILVSRGYEPVPEGIVLFRFDVRG
jgi:hypothetical protein